MKYSLVRKAGGDLSAKRDCRVPYCDPGGRCCRHRDRLAELPQAVAVAMLCAGDDTVGVGAIKQPRQGYARGIAGADKSGFAFDPQMNELGYVAVLAAHRGGRSGQIMNSLLERFNISLWATTSDELMKHSLRNRGFLQKGNEWLNAKGKKLSLWLRYSK